MAGWVGRSPSCRRVWASLVELWRRKGDKQRFKKDALFQIDLEASHLESNRHARTLHRRFALSCAQIVGKMQIGSNRVTDSSSAPLDPSLLRCPLCCALLCSALLCRAVVHYPSPCDLLRPRFPEFFIIKMRDRTPLPHGVLEARFAVKPASLFSPSPRRFRRLFSASPRYPPRLTTGLTVPFSSNIALRSSPPRKPFEETSARSRPQHDGERRTASPASSRQSRSSPTNSQPS